MKRLSLIILFTLFLTLSLSAQTIEWWQFATDPAVKPTIEQIVKEFEEANPGITVNLTDLTWSHGHEKIVLAFSSGEAPDIVELGSDWLAQFAAAGYLEDISSAVDTGSADLQGLSMAKWDDKLYAYPWYLGTRVLFYNNDLIGQAKIPQGFIPVTIEQFKYAVLETMKLGDDIYGWGSNAPEKHRLYKKFLPFLWSMNGQILTDDQRYCVISSEYAIDALMFYSALCKNGGYVGTQRAIEDAFLEGKIAVIFSGDWLVKRIKEEKRNINYSTGLFPGAKFPGIGFMGGEFVAVSKQSENKEAAIKFVKFLCSPENQIKFCKANQSVNPSSKTAQKDPFFQTDPNIKTFILQINMANHPPVHPRWVEMEAAIEEAVEKAVFKNVPDSTALYEAQQTISKILSE